MYTPRTAASGAALQAPLPIRYLKAEIKVAEPLEILEGILLVRLPLPFALNHINVYLLDEGGGWTLVDCGLQSSTSRAAWEKVLASSLVAGRPIRRIVVTHHHPDHVGLAGWLAPRFGAPVLMTRGELAVAGRYADPARDVVAERMGFWREHGLPEDLATALMEKMPRYSRHVYALPSGVQTIGDGESLDFGGRRWRALIGRGHSPEHLCLFDEESGVLLGGDQILPEITPNIAVWPGGDQNPLRSYLASLEQFAALPRDPVLLPSHRQPLRGVHFRVGELTEHHDDRLQSVIDGCATPRTCFELLPALVGRPLRNEEMGFGLGEGVAHLNYLDSRGLLASSRDEQGIRRYSARRH